LTRVIRQTALQRLKDTYKTKSGLLLPRVERHVMRQIKELRPSDHSLEYMHPSDLAKADWCGRHDFYRMTGQPTERKDPGLNPSFRMSNVFAEGHAIHGKWQTWLHEMGVLVGMFRCRECGHRWYDKSPKTCQFCQSERVSYAEFPMRREQMRVEGHADGAVHFPDFRALVEIKSIGIRTLAFEAPRLYQRYLDGTKPEDIWDSITHPFGSHMRQGQLYLWMVWPTYEQIVFIYESKFHQQTKEFVVDYNKSFIAPILEGVREVSQGYRAGVAPDRPDWVTGPEGKVCTSCPYRNTCWGTTDGVQESGDGPEIRVQRSKPAARKRALRTT
jgi:ribosomal protein L37E